MQSLLELGSDAKRKAIAAALLSAVVQVLMFGTFMTSWDGQQLPELAEGPVETPSLFHGVRNRENLFFTFLGAKFRAGRQARHE